MLVSLAEAVSVGADLFLEFIHFVDEKNGLFPKWEYSLSFGMDLLCRT